MFIGKTKIVNNVLQTEDGRYFFDKTTADNVVKFIESQLTHVKAEWGGKKIILEDWQKKIVSELFAWKHTETYEGIHLRRFRYAFIFIPRKNGKSTLCSALALVSLFLDSEPGNIIISAAADRGQARLVFDDAKAMVRQSELLSKNATVYQHSILKGVSSYQPLSADVETKHGLNVNFTVFDELHTQPNRHLYDVLKTSQGSRRQPMFVMITTAGYDLNSICYEQYDYACKVRDGLIQDDTFYPAIFEASKEDDPFSEKTWQKANPNYGKSLKKSYIEQEANIAKQNAAYLNTFLRLQLNIWTSVDVVWITDERWQKCGRKLNIEDFRGETCYAGLDLSSKSDITAFSLIFTPNPNREVEPTKYITFNWFWLPEEKGRDSADKNNNNYKKWVRDGHIIETKGNVIDYDVIELSILTICSQYNVLQIAYDPYNSTQIVAKLEEEGLPMYSFRQGFVSMNFPTLEFEVKVSRCELAHDFNPILRWMVSNGVLLSDTGGKLFKVGKNQPHQKIDGLVTNIMALGLAIMDEGNDNGSYLDDNGVMYVEI